MSDNQELLEFAIILSILMYFVLDLGVILFGRARPSLGQRDKASNVSFRNSLRWPIYTINSVAKTKLS